MAHYAYLDTNNTVVAVIVGKNETELINGLDTEIYYAQGTSYTVKRTSYNNNIRKNYAGIGFTYDTVRDAFIAPKPYASWVLDEATCRWTAPVAMPSEGYWRWDEATVSWVAL